MSELNILFPRPARVRVDGRWVRVSAVRFAEFECFGRVAGALLRLLELASVEDIARYAEQHGEDLQHLLGATTDLSARRLRALPAPVALQLAVQVLRVNADFFGQAQAAMALALAGQMLPSD